MIGGSPWGAACAANADNKAKVTRAVRRNDMSLMVSAVVAKSTSTLLQFVQPFRLRWRLRKARPVSHDSEHSVTFVIEIQDSGRSQEFNYPASLTIQMVRANAEREHSLPGVELPDLVYAH